MRLGSFTKPATHDSHDTAEEYHHLQLKKIGKWIPPTQWDLIDKRNLLCDICSSPVSYCEAVDKMCSLCNVVAHISCLPIPQRELSYRNSWICQYCAEDIVISKDFFLSCQMKLNHQEAKHFSQSLIAKVWRRYKSRKEFLRVVTFVKRIQCLCRKVKAKNRLLESRKAILRPLRLQIEKCAALAITDSLTHSHIYDPYVLITVAQARVFESQLYSVRTKMIKRSTHPVYSESFLIPAISGHQVIVLTVIDRGLIKDEVIGQAIVNLAEKSLWNRGGSLALHLRVMEYQVKSNGHVLHMKDSATRPSGVIHIVVRPCLSLIDYCGWMFAPALESLAIAFRRVRMISDPVLESTRSYGEGMTPQPRIKSKKLWIVLSDKKIFIHDSDGTLCKFVIDLDKVSLDITTELNLFRFTLTMLNIPPLSFQVLECADNMSWKVIHSIRRRSHFLLPQSTFLAAYHSARDHSYSLSSVVEQLHTKQLLPVLKRKDIAAQQITLSRISTPTRLASEVSRPSSAVFPIRPMTTSRPSTTMSRKGVNFVPPTIPIQSQQQEQQDSMATESQFSFSTEGLPEQKSYFHLSPKALLRLKDSSPEIQSSETISRSSYENRTMLISSLNYGLSMILEPDFESEVQINF